MTRSLALTIAVLALPAAAVPQTIVDPDYKFAWQENCGWLNWRDADGGAAGVRVTNRYLEGFIWGENVGWINLDDAAHIVALGPDCPPADLACDGVIDLSDYAAFESYFFGPLVDNDCKLFDTDGDSDVDLFDYAVLQEGFTGSD